MWNSNQSPPLEVQPPTCGLSLRHTHNTYSPSPPFPGGLHHLSSHFHRASFQEIRLISFFFGLSLSLYAVVGCRQRHDCVYQSQWHGCRSAGGQAYYNQLKSHPCLVKLVQTCIIQQRAKGKSLKPSGIDKASRWSPPSIQSRDVNKTAGVVYLMLFCLLFWL